MISPTTASEQQALLPKIRLSSPTGTREITSRHGEVILDNERSSEAKIQFELNLFRSLLSDSIPVILSYVLQNSIQTISILIVGRLGADELACSAFSLMLAFVTVFDTVFLSRMIPWKDLFIGWCVALGGTTALDTLGSQTYGAQLIQGISHPTDLSLHLQRCTILLWLLLAPVCLVWAFIEPVLLALGQAPALSKNVQEFMRVLIWGAPGYIAFESLKKYLQCQGIMGASTFVLAVVSPINVVLNVWLVHYTSLGLLGSPVALSITYWLCFLLLVLVTASSPVHKRNQTWGGLQLRAVFDASSCVTFFKLALPGILMVGTEWAAFEIVALAAGRLGTLPLAAQSVIMTTDQILNTVPFGIGVAASSRVGNLIGARSAQGAKHAAHAAALLSVVVGAVVMTVMLASKDVFGYIFSDDEGVVRLVSEVMPLVASFQIADGLAGASLIPSYMTLTLMRWVTSGSCGGALRGQGRQHLGAIFNFVAYYILALPMGLTLAFQRQLGLQGLWIGQVVALFIVGLGEYATIWLGTDWDEEVRRGIARTQTTSVE